MRKLVVPFLGCIALALVLAACGTPVEPYAALVHGATISTATLDDAMSAIANDTGYRCEILGGASGGSTLTIEGSGSSTYSATFAGDVLSELVQYAAAHEDVTRLGLAEGAYARSLAASELPTALTPQSSTGCAESGPAILASFPSSFRSELEQFELDDDVLSAHFAGVTLTSAGVAAYEAKHPAVAAEDCTSVIEVTTEATAKTARDQIEAGSTFASVAKADSKDSSASAGGAIGCLFPSAFASPLNTDIAALAVGQVSEPLSFDGSWLLIEVTSHKTATATAALPQIFNAEQAKVDALLASSTAARYVSIDPRYGSWAHSSSGWSVKTSTGPADALLPSPSAVTPATASLSPS